VGVVVDHPIEGVRNALVVEDTLVALQNLAGWARVRWKWPGDRSYRQRRQDDDEGRYRGVAVGGNEGWENDREPE